MHIEGEIRTREYTEKPGGKKPVEMKKSITEIRVASIVKLDRKKADVGSEADTEGAAA